MPRRLPLRDGYGIFAFRLASMSTCVCFVARFLQFYRAILRVGPSAVPFSVGWIRRRAIYRATSWVAQCSPSQPISRPQPPCESPRGRLLVGLPGRRSLSFGGDCRSCCCGGGRPGCCSVCVAAVPLPLSFFSIVTVRFEGPCRGPLRPPDSAAQFGGPASACSGRFLRRIRPPCSRARCPPAVCPGAMSPCPRRASRQRALLDGLPEYHFLALRDC